jgi:hypothetical protein
MPRVPTRQSGARMGSSAAGGLRTAGGPGYQQIKQLVANMRPRVQAELDYQLSHVSEWKFYDVPAGITADGSSPPNGQNSAIATVPAVSMTGVLLTAMTQGANTSQRVGDQLTLRSVRLMYRTQIFTSLALGVRELARVLVVQWQGSNIGPTIADILETAAWNSHYKVDPGQCKFKVLYDKIHSHVRGSGSEGQVGYFKTDDFFDGGKVTFDAASALIPRNGLYLLYFASAANSITIDPYSRVEFYDA